MNTQSTPAGYMTNAQGHLIPLELVSPIDLARDTLVKELIKKAAEQSAALGEFKKGVFNDIGAFVEMSAEQYDTKLGGKKGNVTLHSFDGAFKVQFASADNITFDERLQAAKELIDTCIAEWSVGSKPEIIALIQQAFNADKEGKLNTGRVLALRRLDIKDARWQNAMKAIGESVQVVGSKQYVRFYKRRPDCDQYDPISLDIAAI
ncbi:MAG: DUF3164 family protein [Burkholderiaceae bacterium]|nr:DUF3164 family protein [Burkholderiaceae bacterium]